MNDITLLITSTSLFLICLASAIRRAIETTEQGNSPEVWSGCHLEGKASQVDHSVRQQEEHGHERCNGVEPTEKEGHLKERIQSIIQLIYKSIK